MAIVQLPARKSEHCSNTKFAEGDGQESETVFSAPLLSRLGLTESEGEVLHWLAEGKSNPEIAIILGASPRTVGKHVGHIYQKLGGAAAPPRCFA